jgi:DNA-binding transcriptional ArsR family regulator
LPPALAREIAAIFASLSHPTRLRLINALLSQEMCVSELAAALGMSQSAVSHQLSDMREAQLVRSRRDGRRVYYILDDPHVRDLFQQALEHAQHQQQG